jgi:3-ketosteroid 9alpha-monooxygenase subunit A
MNDERTRRWPRGWFRVALSSELSADRPLAVRYFGRELVAFRDAIGMPRVLDGICPHLGARLGDGSVVDGCVRCPFHGWQFAGDGHCSAIPFARKIPARAAVRVWPVVEREGVVFVWHDEAGAPPDFELPSVPEIGAGWQSPPPFRRRLRARLLDVKENIVDFAHFPAVHRAALMGFSRPPRLLQRRADDVSFCLTVETSARILGLPVTTQIELALHGPGVEEARVAAPVALLFRFLTTPIDDDELDFLVLTYVPPSRVPFVSALQASFFRRRVAREVAQDAPIWEHKAFQERPVLSEADGPIVALRTWFSRFYEQRESDTACYG